jgi:four helix bundle protein
MTKMSKLESNGDSRKFDLEDRSAKLGEAIIDFAKRIPVTLITTPLIPQLVRCGTAVGANYCEADDAGSKKEFMYRISLCKRESREAKHWLRMLVRAVPELRDEAKPIWQEAKELNLIFSAIYRRKHSP